MLIEHHRLMVNTPAAQATCWFRDPHQFMSLFCESASILRSQSPKLSSHSVTIKEYRREAICMGVMLSGTHRDND